MNKKINKKNLYVLLSTVLQESGFTVTLADVVNHITGRNPDGRIYKWEMDESSIESSMYNEIKMLLIKNTFKCKYTLRSFGTISGRKIFVVRNY